MSKLTDEIQEAVDMIDGKSDELLIVAMKDDDMSFSMKGAGRKLIAALTTACNNNRILKAIVEIANSNSNYSHDKSKDRESLNPTK